MGGASVTMGGASAMTGGASAAMGGASAVMGEASAAMYGRGQDGNALLAWTLVRGTKMEDLTNIEGAMILELYMKSGSIIQAQRDLKRIYNVW
ncbi:unnamed protein product [Lampetra fluviatilis]